ncbi:class II aldolase/adducin family protein [Cnuibacter sp. UC19_7]|uniref:class II aldolase/adducin family protein n=1 Tax=Cnuibacter sp. UC19_7 TaxID=3350166 RepID=UPI003671B9D7
MSLRASVEVAIARTRAEVARVDSDIIARGLSSLRGGSVSARVPGSDLFVITPGRSAQEAATPADTIVSDLEGRVQKHTIGAGAATTASMATHALLYRRLSTVGGIVHTHPAQSAAWTRPTDTAPTGAAPVDAPLTDTAPAATQSATPVTLPALDGPLDPAVLPALEEPGVHAVFVGTEGLFAVGHTAPDAVTATERIQALADAGDLHLEWSTSPSSADRTSTQTPDAVPEAASEEAKRPLDEQPSVDHIPNEESLSAQRPC